MTSGEIDVRWQQLGAEVYTLESRENRIYIATFDNGRVARSVVDAHNQELAEREAAAIEIKK